MTTDQISKHIIFDQLANLCVKDSNRLSIFSMLIRKFFKIMDDDGLSLIFELVYKTT